MPFVEKTLDTFSDKDRSLLAELTRELRTPRETGQPLIEVRNMSRGGLRHVYVIWDRWEECRPEVRAAVVRDAFAAVKGAAYEKSITLTVAATVPEAADIGLLPFEVQPYSPRDLQGEQLERVREALLAEGASDLGYPALPTLRFTTDQQAKDAIARLKAKVPDVEWGLVVSRVGVA